MATEPKKRFPDNLSGDWGKNWNGETVDNGPSFELAKIAPPF
jgi:hypothetical protein